MRSLLVQILSSVLIASSASAANWDECSKMQELAASSTYTKFWPSTSLSDVRPVDKDTSCTVKIFPPPNTVLDVWLNVSNLDPGTLIISTEEPTPQLLPIALTGSNLYQLTSAFAYDIYISGTAQTHQGATFAMSFTSIPLNDTFMPFLFPVNPMQVSIFGSPFFGNMNVTSFDVVPNADGLHPVLFLVYFGDTHNEYDLMDRISFFKLSSPVFSGNDLVRRRRGVAEIGYTAGITTCWAQLMDQNFQAALLVYGYNITGQMHTVKWEEYQAWAWEDGTTYKMGPTIGTPTVVFIRDERTFASVGHISNVVLNGGTLRVYEQIAEITVDGTFGQLLATFEPNKIPINLPYTNFTYTFVVENGPVSFTLSSTPPPSQPSTVGSTSTIPTTIPTTTSTIQTSTIPTTTRLAAVGRLPLVLLAGVFAKLSSLSV